MLRNIEVMCQFGCYPLSQVSLSGASTGMKAVVQLTQGLSSSPLR